MTPSGRQLCSSETYTKKGSKPSGRSDIGIKHDFEVMPAFEEGCVVSTETLRHSLGFAPTIPRDKPVISHDANLASILADDLY